MQTSITNAKITTRVKKATTVEEQIEKLKARGMVMDLDEKKTQEILLDIGYYRLGSYWNPFEIDKNIT